MISIEVIKLSKDTNNQLCCKYSAIMLYNDGCEITVSFKFIKLFFVIDRPK